MPLIVLEGLDGAGKSTQLAKLREYLSIKGIEYEYLHFPRFDAPVYGEQIARFLRGEFGTANQVDPYLVALLYAGDRADVAPQIRQWLRDGKFVLLDRYVYSNIAFQCAKLSDEGEKRRLAEWILSTEFGYFNLPKPDISIFLDVPFHFTESRLTESRGGEDRDYLKGATDIHEVSLDLQKRVREVYIASSGADADLHIIDCSDGRGNMDTPDNNFAKIRKFVEPLLIADGADD